MKPKHKQTNKQKSQNFTLTMNDNIMVKEGWGNKKRKLMMPQQTNENNNNGIYSQMHDFFKSYVFIHLNDNTLVQLLATCQEMKEMFEDTSFCWWHRYDDNLFPDETNHRLLSHKAVVSSFLPVKDTSVTNSKYCLTTMKEKYSRLLSKEISETLFYVNSTEIKEKFFRLRMICPTMIEINALFIEHFDSAIDMCIHQRPATIVTTAIVFDKFAQRFLEQKQQSQAKFINFLNMFERIEISNVGSMSSLNMLKGYKNFICLSFQHNCLLTTLDPFNQCQKILIYDTVVIPSIDVLQNPNDLQCCQTLYIDKVEIDKNGGHTNTEDNRVIFHLSKLGTQCLKKLDITIADASLVFLDNPNWRSALSLRFKTLMFRPEIYLSGSYYKISIDNFHSWTCLLSQKNQVPFPDSFNIQFMEMDMIQFGKLLMCKNLNLSSSCRCNTVSIHSYYYFPNELISRFKSQGYKVSSRMFSRKKSSPSGLHFQTIHVEDLVYPSHVENYHKCLAMVECLMWKLLLHCDTLVFTHMSERFYQHLNVWTGFLEILGDKTIQLRIQQLGKTVQWFLTTKGGVKSLIYDSKQENYAKNAITTIGSFRQTMYLIPTKTKFILEHAKRLFSNLVIHFPKVSVTKLLNSDLCSNHHLFDVLMTSFSTTNNNNNDNHSKDDTNTEKIILVEQTLSLLINLRTRIIDSFWFRRFCILLKLQQLVYATYIECINEMMPERHNSGGHERGRNTYYSVVRDKQSQSPQFDQLVETSYYSFLFNEQSFIIAHKLCCSKEFQIIARLIANNPSLFNSSFYSTRIQNHIINNPTKGLEDDQKMDNNDCPANYYHFVVETKQFEEKLESLTNEHQKEALVLENFAPHFSSYLCLLYNEFVVRRVPNKNSNINNQDIQFLFISSVKETFRKRRTTTNGVTERCVQISIEKEFETIEIEFPLIVQHCLKTCLLRKFIPNYHFNNINTTTTDDDVDYTLFPRIINTFHQHF